jgi:hypothetical protein
MKKQHRKRVQASKSIREGGNFHMRFDTDGLSGPSYNRSVERKQLQSGRYDFN